MYWGAVAIISTSQTPYSGHSARQTDQHYWPSMVHWQWGEGWLSWLSLMVDLKGVLGGLVGLWGQRSWTPTQASITGHQPGSVSWKKQTKQQKGTNKQTKKISADCCAIIFHNYDMIDGLQLVTALSRETIVHRRELWHSWKGSQPSGNVQINVCEPSSA